MCCALLFLPLRACLAGSSMPADPSLGQGKQALWFGLPRRGKILTQWGTNSIQRLLVRLVN